MKPAQLVASLVLVLTGAVLCHAQAAPYSAAVKTAEAEVRSGPSADPKMYVTNRLRQGDVVQVVKAREDGWLEIKPPTGSFSWINTRFVDRTSQQNPTYVVVTQDDYPVPVRIGSSVVDEKPTVEGPRLPRGTLVVAIGNPLTSQDEGMWLPIEPPPQEVRYIRADVVQATKTNEPPMAPPAAVGTASGGGAAPAPPAPAPPPSEINLSGGGGSGSTTTTSTSNAPAPAAPPADPDSPEGMWQQAQQMEQAGRKAEAESLYTKLAHKVSQVNHDLAMKCYNRIHYLKEGIRTAAQQGGFALTLMQRPTGSAADNRLSPTPGNTNTPAVDCHVTACPGDAQVASYGAVNNPAPTLDPQVMGPGLLRLAGRGIDNQRAYALEDRGQLLMYVTAQPGVNLESYVGRIVSLYGPMVYRGDLNKNYMRVMSVTPAP
jgi:uncharacterized protein YraI